MSSNKKNVRKKGDLAKTVRKVRGEKSRMVKERKRKEFEQKRSYDSDNGEKVEVYEMEGLKSVGRKKAAGRRNGMKPSGFGKIEDVVGTVSMGRGGYGFITVEGRKDDIFIPEKKMHSALSGDTVRVAIKSRRGKFSNSGSNSFEQRHDGQHFEGEVLAIIERSDKPYVGLLQIIYKTVWVIIESKSMPYDIKLPFSEELRSLEGHKVAVKITRWRDGMDAPLGQLLDDLGLPGDNETEMHAILAEYDLPYRFSDEVEQAASGIPVKISRKDIEERRDFRKTLTFTIDPADAKDFDDALSFKQLENSNFEVGVHIADVTHYVRPNDTIDTEGYQRGTSVYLVDRTIPMLPEVLSNNLCSLRPGEEKLTFSVVFELDEKANIKDTWYGRTIIKSDRRFCYEEVQEYLEDNGLAIVGGVDRSRLEALKQQAAGVDEGAQVKKRSSAREKAVFAALGELQKLAAILRKKRFSHGAIEFERPEMKVLVDQEGKPYDVIQKMSYEANWLIEEFMLLANKAVATYVAKMKAKKTFVYRVHDAPDMEKIEQLRGFIHHFGYAMGPTENGKSVARELNSLMKKVKSKPESNAIQILALRSMARAKYTTDNIGHYGLAFDYYTHFTSPIRRYPDMMVHRLLARYLAGEESVSAQKWEEFCKYCSSREQLATEAERASVKYKMAEYLQSRIGQEFEGTISGLTERGMYVEIEPTKIEGMISLRDIKEDYFEFDEKEYTVTGKRTKKVYRLGDKVRIKVLKVSLEQRLIDYTLVSEYK